MLACWRSNRRTILKLIQYVLQWENFGFFSTCNEDPLLIETGINASPENPCYQLYVVGEGPGSLAGPKGKKRSISLFKMVSLHWCCRGHKGHFVYFDTKRE